MEMSRKQLVIMDRALGFYVKFLSMQIDFEEKFNIDPKTLENLHVEFRETGKLQQDVLALLLRD